MRLSDHPAELKRRFDAHGYVVVRGLLDADEVAALRAAIESAPERDQVENPLTLDTMRFASNLFYASEELQRFLCARPVVDLLCAVGPQDLWVRWDQAVWKGANAPTFPWHQDNGYTGLPVQHLQLWVALTPMNSSNGGLVLAPGGHRSEQTHRWIGNHVEIDEPTHQLEIDAAAGDVVLFSSYLPHMTTPNLSGEERLAYVAEYLPIDTDDSSVRPPHLVASRAGAPVGEFTDVHPRPPLTARVR